jgi:hypothetical protein
VRHTSFDAPGGNDRSVKVFIVSAVLSARKCMRHQIEFDMQISSHLSRRSVMRGIAAGTMMPAACGLGALLARGKAFLTTGFSPLYFLARNYG